MRRRTTWLIRLLLAAGCSQIATPSRAADPATQPSSPTIAIDNFHFTPATITVARGAVVTWVNRDDVPHTATAKGESPLFDSDALDTDAKFSFTFSAPGTYVYYCKVHPHMTGTVIVK
jgi:plastocyanin